MGSSFTAGCRGPWIAASSGLLKTCGGLQTRDVMCWKWLPVDLHAMKAQPEMPSGPGVEGSAHICGKRCSVSCVGCSQAFSDDPLSHVAAWPADISLSFSCRASWSSLAFSSVPYPMWPLGLSRLSLSAGSRVITSSHIPTWVGWRCSVFQSSSQLCLFFFVTLETQAWSRFPEKGYFLSELVGCRPSARLEYLRIQLISGRTQLLFQPQFHRWCLLDVEDLMTLLSQISTSDYFNEQFSCFFCVFKMKESGLSELLWERKDIKRNSWDQHQSSLFESYVPWRFELGRTLAFAELCKTIFLNHGH